MLIISIISINSIIDFRFIFQKRISCRLFTFIEVSVTTDWKGFGDDSYLPIKSHFASS